jgi:hypothetical protein
MIECDLDVLNELCERIANIGLANEKHGDVMTEAHALRDELNKEREQVKKRRRVKEALAEALKAAKAAKAGKSLKGSKPKGADGFLARIEEASSRLRSALAEAEKNQIRGKELGAAGSLLRDLKLPQQALDALRDAMAMGTPAALSAGMARAREQGLGEEDADIMVAATQCDAQCKELLARLQAAHAEYNKAAEEADDTAMQGARVSLASAVEAIQAMPELDFSKEAVFMTAQQLLAHIALDQLKAEPLAERSLQAVEKTLRAASRAGVGSRRMSEAQEMAGRMRQQNEVKRGLQAAVTLNSQPDVPNSQALTALRDALDAAQPFGRAWGTRTPLVREARNMYVQRAQAQRAILNTRKSSVLPGGEGGGVIRRRKLSTEGRNLLLSSMPTACLGTGAAGPVEGAKVGLEQQQRQEKDKEQLHSLGRLRRLTMQSLLTLPTADDAQQSGWLAAMGDGDDDGPAAQSTTEPPEPPHVRVRV